MVYPVEIPNWTVQSIVVLISMIPMILAFFIALYHFRKWGFRPFLIMMIFCALGTLVCLSVSLSDLFLSIPLLLISYLLFIPIGLFVNLLFDSISREGIDYLKMSLLSICSVALIFVSLYPSPFPNSNPFNIDTFPNGDWGAFSSLPVSIVVGLLFILIGSFFVYYLVRIYLEAPQNLKRQALQFLLGGISVGVLAPASAALGIYKIIPEIHITFFTIGGFFCAYLISIQPKLIYILPFKVLRLAIIHKDGIPLYTHVWEKTKESFDPLLFSGMMQAIVTFVQESLDKGNVREIHLDEAVLLLKRTEEHPVVIVLITTKTSQILRQTLDVFVERFYKQFSQYFSNPNKTDNFKPTLKLISDCFPYVPQYLS